MENELIKTDFNPALPSVISSPASDAGKKTASVIKSINFSGDQWVIVNELPGVYFKGIQYYDLKNIGFINNTGMASLIDLLKSLLENDIEVRFVNVNDSIKAKIKSMGLEHILRCGQE